MLETTNNVYADVDGWIEHQTQKEEASVEALVGFIATAIEKEVS